MKKLGEKFWEKYFKVYDVLNIVIPYQELMAELEKELDLNQDDIVLDVGSGTGNFMIRIKNKCKKIFGLDFSEAGIKIHKSKDSPTKVILCDITQKFPFSDNYFSKIVSNNTIYTLTEKQQNFTLSEMYRVLKLNGKIVVSNIKKDYSPFEIYLKHISKSIKEIGFSKTSFLIVKLLNPTLRMFYYNAKIKKNGLTNCYHFLNDITQKELLKQAGFKNISETKYVFTNQAIMNSGYKL